MDCDILLAIYFFTINQWTLDIIKANYHLDSLYYHLKSYNISLIKKLIIIHDVQWIIINLYTILWKTEKNNSHWLIIIQVATVVDLNFQIVFIPSIKLNSIPVDIVKM